VPRAASNGEMPLRAKLVIATVWMAACGSDGASSELAAPMQRSDASVAHDTSTQTAGAAADGARAGASGGGGRRSPLSCTQLSDAEKQVTCGGQTCPLSADHEKDPCFVPCCVTFEGADRCGFRGTSAAFTTECVLPAQSDPSCDEVPQFEGCCEPTMNVCGVIGGFAPGCQTESRFATLPEHPKACGAGRDADAGPAR
jgi:hypothetical protein